MTFTAEALAKLLIEKGLISEAEFLEKLKAERGSYQALIEKMQQQNRLVPPIKDTPDHELVADASKGFCGQGHVVEMMMRVKNLLGKVGLSIAQLVVGCLTLGLAIFAATYAYYAYNVAFQQIKDIGSWLRVRVVDFQYTRPGEKGLCGRFRRNDSTDTWGCFTIIVSNRLSANAINTSFDHKVPPQDWVSDWKLKEGILDPGNYYTLQGADKQKFILTRVIDLDPIKSYCNPNKPENGLKFFVITKWEDDKGLIYNQTDNFKADCIKTKEGKTIFKWIHLS